MERIKRNTDRFRPLFAPGGILDALSVAQQEPKREAVAVQKHHPIPVAMHPKIFPCDVDHVPAVILLRS